MMDIDTQVDFIEPRGKLYANGAETIRDTLLRFKVNAVKHGIKIVSSVCAHAEGDPEFAEFPPHCLKGSAGQKKIPETETGLEFVVPNEPDAPMPPADCLHVVVEKQDFPIFTNCNIDRILDWTGVKEAVLYGVVTEVCVRAAALGLRERGWRVCLVEDAVWPLNKKGGAAALKEMADAGVEIMKSDHILRCLGAVGS